jgi:hypothetical protein
MDHIVTVQEAVTAFAPWLEPTDAELEAIEREMPAIEADIAAMDEQITAPVRPVRDLERRRIRREGRRALSARRELTNQAAELLPEVA